MSAATPHRASETGADARAEILRRIRQALGPDRPQVEIPRQYRARGDLGEAERVDLFEERLRDYRADVRRCSAADLEECAATCLRERGARRVVVPPTLRIGLPDEVHAVVDRGDLSAIDLDHLDGVVTRCAVGIAETGTIVLDGASDQGRRAISLVPDYHLCIVEARQVVATVPEAVARLDPSRPQTWISGPSATSDIELRRVEGVHGPRTLEVILVT